MRAASRSGVVRVVEKVSVRRPLRALGEEPEKQFDRLVEVIAVLLARRRQGGVFKIAKRFELISETVRVGFHRNVPEFLRARFDVKREKKTVKINEALLRQFVG